MVRPGTGPGTLFFACVRVYKNGMKQKIIAFHLDNEKHWVADLNCGHKQHVRHDPPLVERPWVLKEETRIEKVGTELNCKSCDEWGRAISQQVVKACLENIDEAIEEAGMAGLCKEGQIELMKDRIKGMDLIRICEQVIKEELIQD